MGDSADNWNEGDAYEAYMGRWSRPLARAFIGWLAPSPTARWLDIGCGTGALTSAICEIAEPSSVLACDPSKSFVDHAVKTVRDPRVSFAVATTESLPGHARDFDYAVSALVLNFIPEPARVIRLMAERLRRRGIVAACVWDYGGGLEFLRRFWDEAAALDPAAEELDEGRRFPICQPEALNSLFQEAGLKHIGEQALEIPTRFKDFEDFWTPFLRGTGPAPAYAAALPLQKRDRLKEAMLRRLKTDPDGGISLRARAWAISGLAE